MVTLQNALEEFYLSMDGVVSSKTVLWYQNRLKTLVEFIGSDTDIETITIHQLRDWRSKLARRTVRWANHPYRPSSKGGLSTESIFCFVRATKHFFRWLQDEEYISKNPAFRLEKPVLPKRRKKGLSIENRDKLIEHAYHSCERDYAITLFLADTACRVGGVADLRISNIDMDKRRALVKEKGMGGGAERWIFFKPPTGAALVAYLKVRPPTSDDHVFMSTHRPYKPLTENGIYQVVKRLAHKAGILKGWNPHNWRHGSIRGMLDKGMPLPAASEIAGHSSTGVTGDIYGTFPENQLSEMHDRYSWLPDKLPDISY